MPSNPDPKVRWVKSWRELPGGTSSAYGHVTSKGVIYGIKGKTTKADVEHEKAHIALGHSSKSYPTAAGHVRQEIQATYVAYSKIGQPKHILSLLRGIYNDLAYREYRGAYKTPNKILKVIKTNLNRYPIPKEWKQDFHTLVRLVGQREGSL